MKSKGTELNELEEITIETIQNTIHEKKNSEKRTNRASVSCRATSSSIIHG